MKGIKYILSATLILGTLFFAIWQPRTSAQSQDSLLQLSLTAEPERYALGETLKLNFALKNVSDEALEIGKPSVYTGSLRLWISEDGVDFREYQGPHWGRLNAGHNRVKLAAGKSLQAKATLLYNHRFPTEHL